MHKFRLLWAAHNEEVWLRRCRRNNNRCLENIWKMDDCLFMEKFRLDKITFRKLCQVLRVHASLRGTKEIPLEIKVLCTLSFLATGLFQRMINVTQHIPQRTASRCIRQVVEALNSSYMLRHIAFPPTPQDRSNIRQAFQRRFNLPGVIGCIDCTHVAIVKPGYEEHLFHNRKGYHSLNVQMICDDNLKIINVNSKYGGASRDSFIWASSQVGPYMRELHRNGEETWLLGDSGYPQRAWLMTPILNATPGSEQEIYNTRHKQARNCIERCFRLLKGRWKCLLQQRPLHYHPHVASKIVLACCVLHNIALQAGLPAPVDIVAELDDDEAPVGLSVASSQEELMHGRTIRNSLISRLLY